MRRLMIVLTVALAGGAYFSFAAATKKMSVKDYYYLLPADIFPFDASNIENRKKFLNKKTQLSEDFPLSVDKIIDDPKNGYLAIHYTSMCCAESISFAIWRTRDGQDLVGVSRDNSIDALPRFFLRVSDSWREVTGEVFADFKKAAFKPTAKWPEYCGKEGGGAAELMEFPKFMHCPMPRQGLDITCNFRFQCLTLGANSVSELETSFGAKDYYQKPSVKFKWKNQKFSPD